MRNLMPVCASLAILTGVVSLNLWRELRTEREKLHELPVRSAAMPESRVTPIPPVSPAPPPPPPASKPGPSGQADDGAVTASLTRFLAADAARLQAQVKDPEYRKARFARQRMLLPQEYPGLVERLGLASEEADKLFDLLTGVQLEKLDANASNPFIPGQPGDVAVVQELMRLRQQIQRRRVESLVALLGSGRYGQFTAYEDRASAQSNRRLLEAVQPHLDTRQLETYKTILDQQLAQSRASTSARAARSAGKIAVGPRR